MRTLASLWTWFAMITLIVIWLPLLALIRLFDRDPARYRTGRWFRRLGATMTGVNPAWTIMIDGKYPSNPRNPYVVVSNHQSHADIPVISRLPWEMKWVAKAELFRLPFVGWLMRLAGDIPVNREDGRSRAGVLVLARSILKDKCSVMFFPEGTRSRDGRVLRFNEGAFRLAIKEQVPILPLALDGTQNALPKNNWRFGQADHIRLRILPEVPTEGLTGADVELLRDRVRTMIVEQIAVWRGTAPEEVDATHRPNKELVPGDDDTDDDNARRA
jgi:1-acyl-sn-glycerol-3-phosphate acyltransferase